MVTLNLNIPTSFTSALSTFMGSMNKFIATTNQLSQIQSRGGGLPVSRIPTKFIPKTAPVFRSQKYHIQVGSLMNRLVPIFGRFGHSLLHAIDRLLMTMGPRARIFIKTLRMVEDIFSNVGNILRFIGAPGLLGKIPGVGWIFSIGIFTFKAIRWIWEKSIALVENVRQDHLESIVMGTTVGGLRSLRIFLGQFPFDPKLLQSLSLARFSTISSTAATIFSFGIKRQQDTVNTYMSVLLRASAMMKRFPGKEELAAQRLLADRGIEMTPELRRALISGDIAELRRRVEQVMKERRSYELGASEQEAMQLTYMKETLYIQWQVLFYKTMVESSLASALTRLAKWLVEFLKRMTKWLETLFPPKEPEKKDQPNAPAATPKKEQGTVEQWYQDRANKPPEDLRKNNQRIEQRIRGFQTSDEELTEKLRTLPSVVGDRPNLGVAEPILDRNGRPIIGPNGRPMMRWKYPSGGPGQRGGRPSLVPLPPGTPVQGGYPVRQGSAETDQAIQDAAKEAGIDPNTMRGIASIESDMEPNANWNKSTQYKGLYQIGREEWAKYGKGNIYNAHDNAMAAARMFAAHREEFKARFGRYPTDQELYMIHQQGMGFFTRGTMTNIGGNQYPGMRGPQTPDSFMRGWGAELQRRKAQYEKKYGGKGIPGNLTQPFPGTTGASRSNPDDIAYLQAHGAHSTVNGHAVPVDSIMGEGMKPMNPEFAARLAAAGRAYRAETGHDPVYGEMNRDIPTQAVYYWRYQHGLGGIAAAPGRSQHHYGFAADLPSGAFRDWLYKNGGRYGIHFPVRGDEPHAQPILQDPRIFYKPPIMPGAKGEIPRIIVTPKQPDTESPIDPENKKQEEHGEEEKPKVKIENQSSKLIEKHHEGHPTIDNSEDAGMMLA